jgi:hypothetical protein
MKAENQKSAVLSCHKTHGTTILHKLTMAVVKNSATTIISTMADI